MVNKIGLMMAVLWLGGCMVAPTSTVEPMGRNGGAAQSTAPQTGGGYGNANNGEASSPSYGAPTPVPGSVRKSPAVIAYAENSTGVTAADALLRDGKAQHQRGQYANAANNFERAIRMAPRSPALYLALAKTKLALNDYSSAIQMANRALSLLPSEGWGVDDARADAWTIIADGRAATGDQKGSAAARTKAREYF